MRLIDADDFIEKMHELYEQAKWGKREIHFSLADLECNVDMMPTAHKPTDEWCTTCKEYDQEKKCCPKFNRVIRNAMPEIVYCKECKYNINNPVPFYDDDPIMTYAWCNTECFDENGFCSCGKRIEE